jgi:leucyl-tRNA synthetase
VESKYTPGEIEPKWQRLWAQQGLDQAPEGAESAQVLRPFHVSLPVG